MDLFQHYLGSEHLDTIESAEALSGAYTWLGRFEEAIGLQERLVEVRKAKLGPDHPQTLRYVKGLAGTYQAAGQWDASSRLLEDLLTRQRALDGPRAFSTADTLQLLGMNSRMTGRLAESMAFFEASLKVKEAAGTDPTWTLIVFARVCQRAGELDRADRLLRDSLETNRRREDSEIRRTSEANSHGWQAVGLLLRGKYAAAEPLAREALTTFHMYRPNMSRCYFWMSTLGAALLGQGRITEAGPLLLQGYEGMKAREAAMPGFDMPLLTEAGERLARYHEATDHPEKGVEVRNEVNGLASRRSR